MSFLAFESVDSSSNEQALTEQFALATWSLLCEPGDRVAGFIVERLGAVQALGLEVSSATPSDYLAKLTQVDGVDEAQTTFSNFERTIAEARQRWKPRLNQAEVTKALEVQKKIGGRFATRDSAFWPLGLDDLGYAKPHALWIRGRQELLNELEPSVAIVGSRNSSSYGETVTSEIVTELVAKNIPVISGGAYGIDAIAHRATLALQGQTVAVLAGGVDKLYPSGNSKLLERVISEGSIVSELPPGSTPTKWRFLQRNRLIAAMSSATVVVEAGLPSGAINTSNHALELGRPVGAVPGQISTPYSRGCHCLIQDGKAQLISSAEDVISLINSGQVGFMQTEIAGLGALETRAFDALGSKQLDLQQICTAAGITSGEAQLALGSLELLGLVARSNGRFSKLR